jgi:hypothetical protein
MSPKGASHVRGQNTKPGDDTRFDTILPGQIRRGCGALMAARADEGGGLTNSVMTAVIEG